MHALIDQENRPRNRWWKQKHALIVCQMILAFILMSPLSESCHASPSATTAIQSKKIKEPEAYKFSFWTPSISLMHYAPFSSEKELPSSGGLKIAVGYGQARGRLLWHGNFDIYLGPYGITSEGAEQPVDYRGVGFSAYVGLGGGLDPQQHLRINKSNYGLITGLSVVDLSGRSFSADSSYNSQVRIVNLEFGMFYLRLKPPRVDDYQPDNLVTRDEGIIIRLTAGFPLQGEVTGFKRVTKTINNVETEEKVPFSSGVGMPTVSLTIIAPLGV